MVLNYKVRESIDSIQSQMESEKSWWEKRREQNASELKNDSEEKGNDEVVLVDTA